MSKPLPQAAFQRWLHSHEEDTPTHRVYRPASYAFPPSRGRSGFELRPDGSVTQIGISPRDGASEQAGTWALQGEGEGDAEQKIVVTPASGTPLVLRLAQVEPDRLVVEK